MSRGGEPEQTIRRSFPADEALSFLRDQEEKANQAASPKDNQKSAPGNKITLGPTI